MMAKAGFILLVLVFGALMFAAGALAPAGVKQMLDRAARKLEAYVPASLPVIKADMPALPAAADGAASVTNASAAIVKPAAVPAQNLLIPTPLPEKGLYALQAGQFGNGSDADALYDAIQVAKLPAQKILNVQDQAGKLWTVVAVGPYASIDTAGMVNRAVASQLGLAGPLPVILLPSPAPPKS